MAYSAVQHTQQLHLKPGVQLPHFVQEDGSVMGQLEQSWFGGIGAAEGASLVPE